MAMYVPEIVEEVSEDAKMLVVEEDGKVYKIEMPKVNHNSEETDMVIKIETSPNNWDIIKSEVAIAYGSCDNVLDKMDNGEIPCIELKMFQGLNDINSLSVSSVKANYVERYYNKLYVCFSVECYNFVIIIIEDEITGMQRIQCQALDNITLF